MERMDEVVLTIPGMTKELGIFLLKNMYHKILCEDEQWHFFFEYNKLVVRFVAKHLKRFEKVVKGELQDMPEASYYFTKYDENIKITKKYIEHFVPIFHHFAIMSLKFKPEEDLQGITDRIFHCWLNMAMPSNGFDAYLKSIPDSDKVVLGEALVGAHMTVMRAFTVGWFGAGGTTDQTGDKYRG